MKATFMKIKNSLSKAFTTEDDEYDVPHVEEEYVELNTDMKGSDSKITVRPFILEDFSDVKQVLDSLREGYTIALVNIKPLKDKDLVELKRAINKLKKTCDAISGDIAGFGEEWVIVAPSFVEVYREASKKVAAAQKKQTTSTIEYDDFE
ncbi:hypothetical protein COV93_00890 [Candidatus Woesearchaeota archaeon CG11_big_fil_rev_8_21_14_0_20_43_8]|nr:MAG: hypothetical protein COV93_00890 [Candidatus Woesearchaeota archaeon CG11_big_fil_rev_8_21_14_0_20_43_8]PIO04634.1 MAG: hypothetical protein COT47_08170 [Candidatus Woesearchaeota archaeon CG08_land_8_20_14_0_20_43_7]